MGDVIEVTAETIDGISELSAIDRWLAETRDKVSTIVASGDYKAHKITSDEAYKQAKRDRASLNRHITAIDADRRQMTAGIEARIKELRDGTKDALAPLAEIEAAYKDEISAWDAGWAERRDALLADEYASFAGDLAELVTYDLLAARYAGPGKWRGRSTGSETAKALVRDAATAVAQTLAVIDDLGLPPERTAAVRAKYLLDLDLEKAVSAERAEHAATELASEVMDAARERSEGHDAERPQEPPTADIVPPAEAAAPPAMAWVIVIDRADSGMMRELMDTARSLGITWSVCRSVPDDVAHRIGGDLHG